MSSKMHMYPCVGKTAQQQGKIWEQEMKQIKQVFMYKMSYFM